MPDKPAKFKKPKKKSPTPPPKEPTPPLPKEPTPPPPKEPTPPPKTPTPEPDLIQFEDPEPLLPLRLNNLNFSHIS